MKHSECGLLDEIFTRIDDRTGEVLHFNATALFNWALEHSDQVMLATVPLTHDLMTEMFNDRHIEQWKIDRLKEPYSSIPALGVEDTDHKHILIDGNHRVYNAWKKGKSEFPAIVVPFGKWEPFLVTDFPKWLTDIAVDDIKRNIKGNG